MHILKIATLLLGGLFLYSCSPQGAVTPEMAHIMLRDAYRNSDSEMFTAQLSRKSIEKIQFILANIKKTDRGQCENIASKIGTDCDTLKKLTPVSYVSLQLSLDRKPGNNSIKNFLQSEITGKKSFPQKCTLVTANGMEINFVKEGPYWKLDFRDF